MMITLKPACGLTSLRILFTENRGGQCAHNLSLWGMNSERDLLFIILIIHMGMQLGKLGFLCNNDASICFWNVPRLATLRPPWFGIPFWNAPLPVSVPYEGGVSVNGCEETARAHSCFDHRGPAACQPCSGRGHAAATVPALVTLCLRGGRPGTGKCAGVRCQAGDTVWSKRRSKSRPPPPVAQGEARRRKVTSVYLVPAAAESSRPAGCQALASPLGSPSPPAVGSV